MGEKKVVSRAVAIALGIIVILLALGMGEVVLYYNAQITEIQNQKEVLKTPELVNVGLGANPETQQGAYFVHIIGYVCNVGINTAYKCKLHVTTQYASGGCAIDTYIDIGNGGILAGGESAKVDVSIPYQVYGIGATTMTPQWSNTP